MFLTNIFGRIRGPIALFFCLIFIFTMLILATTPQSLSQVINDDRTGCNCIVFRLDDIQDHFLNKSQLAIMNLFLEKNQSLSLALILNYLGNDTSILNKVVTGHERGNFELDSHGWNHENFSNLSESSQIELLKKANEKTYSLFGVRPNVFVPPFFEFNNLTFNAMREAGLTIISSYDRIYVQKNQSYLITNITNITNSNPGDSNTIIHFPNTVEYSFFDGKKWKTHPTEQVLANIGLSIMDYGYAVTTLHPQAFVPMENGTMVDLVNATQLGILEDFLDSIKSRGIRITDFNHLNQMRSEMPVGVLQIPG